jgi:hypothetical protein
MDKMDKVEKMDSFCPLKTPYHNTNIINNVNNINNDNNIINMTTYFNESGVQDNVEINSDPESDSENEKKYTCNYCNYNTCVKNDYNKHLITKKHMKNEKKSNGTNEIVDIIFKCENCCKEFTLYNSYWKHRSRICKKKVDTNIVSDQTNSVPITRTNNKSNANSNTIDNNTAIEILKQNSELVTKNTELYNVVIEICKENKELHKLIAEQSKNNIVTNNITNNTINNQFNLNFFLNEQCKDAINIDMFLNELVISVADYEQTSKIGYVENISRILINGLKQLDVYKRPIHCTDIKRDTIYIKDNNKWEKDTENNEKITKVVKDVAERNFKTFPKWAELHPNFKELDTVENKQFHELYEKSLGSQTENGLAKDHDKIIKNVLKTVTIDEVKTKI